ncbi:beta-phosphoglucomutase [Chengkuizengella axinellae]|uniref:Beta-phosphoglucomutase n=1 Tax=Chengkuizengella axinellae TaxID=3064388 RepID=A0ABT9IW49_9BACL|nr:beta-phosphoglucomutase [Chengkuizengella sp. 2205SS18-9]MDP5273044.1 beta-phosphoglucomutase [Chengkuizengella sp. 2205SS18-9]
MTNFKLFIFDLDGVLTESSEQHFLAWKKLSDELGISIDEKFNDQLKGISRMDSLERILANGGIAENYSKKQKEDLAARKNEYYVSMISQFTEENLNDGVRELFSKLKKHNILIAIGSASKNAPLLLKKLNIEKYIDYIVNPKNLKSKPAPDIFLNAANKWSIEPRDCVGIEDSVSGISSIKSAGMFAIGIGDQKVLNQADIVYKQTKEVNLLDLLK